MVCVLCGVLSAVWCVCTVRCVECGMVCVYCCERLPQKEKIQEDSLHLELLRTSNDCIRVLSKVLRLRECADNKGRHLTDNKFRK